MRRQTFSRACFTYRKILESRTAARHNRGMTLQTIKHLLYVQDMSRAVGFYRDGFGLDVSLESEHWSELRYGNAIVALHSGGDGTDTQTGLSFQMKDVKATCEHLASLGATVLENAIQRSGEPIMLGRVRDPEGNEIMVTQYIG